MLAAPPAASRTSGRRAQPDSRDLRYLLVDGEPGLTLPTREVRVLRGPVYDNPEAALAVPYALFAALHATPRVLGPSKMPDPWLVRERALCLDGPQRVSAPLGLTLRQGCRVLRRMGLVEAYHWSFDLSEITSYLGSGRGLVLGLDWYASMSKPDETGLVRAWGNPVGGHAVFAWGVDPIARVVLIQNQWGPSWGGWSTRRGRRDFQGCAKLPYDDLRKLLSDNGEAVALVKGH